MLARAEMTPDSPQLQLRLARDPHDLAAAQRLRFAVFVEELGAQCSPQDRADRLERDLFDAVCDHLVLIDTNRDATALDHVVGAYRLLPSDRAAAFGRFYCDGEYDLSPLRASGRRLLELGRSCVHADYRGSAAMYLLWNGLADYVLDHGIEVMFGVASFHGTDPQALAEPLAWLHHHHLAPPELRARALPGHYQRMDIAPPEVLDRVRALSQMPALIKAYLRLGGCVGEGAFIDTEFNTIDVLLMMDTAAMSKRHHSFYARRHEARA